MTHDTPMSGFSGRELAIIGTGYVGLSAAACFASLGHDVTCSDSSEAKVRDLRAGRVEIVEQGLADLVTAMVAAGRLRFTTDNLEAVRGREFVFLCLPTPDGGDGRADLSYVLQVASQIATELATGAVVINKSTVPVGTAQKVADCLGRADVDVVSNPEFLAEGTAVRDFMDPDRIVVGGQSRAAATRVAALYAPLDAPTIVTDAASAETIKYAANAFLATKLSFVNALAALCEATGADIGPVAEGMGADSRIGPKFLQPGPGWGGSCFPKDSRALASLARDVGTPLDVLEAAISENARHTSRVIEKVRRGLQRELRGVRVCIWGLTFKAGTNDLRDSPALVIASDLSEAGAQVTAYDPTVAFALPDIEVASSAVAACEGADALIVATEWPEFRSVDLDAVAGAMQGRLLIDARNLLDGDSARLAGLDYEGLGRPPASITIHDTDVTVPAVMAGADA